MHHKIENFASKIDRLRSSLTLATILALRASAHHSTEKILSHLNALEIAGQARVSDKGETLEAIQLLVDLVQSDTGPRLENIHEQILACLNQVKNLQRELPQTRERNILQWLNFRPMAWRYEEVPSAYRRTFQWIFQSSTGVWDDFVAYLSGTDVVAPYFINGKAGSGKSTLMKFIVSNSKTREALARWAGPADFLVVNFFFWNLGTTLQRSNVGMLRALIHAVLKKHPELIPAVFPSLYQNWKSSDANDEPSYIEVKKAFEILIEKSSKFLKLCIFIDGLDEFEGDHREMSRFLRSLASDHVKFVISSRPISSCLNAFKGCPTLRLQDLTMNDMEIFVNGELCSHESMIKLARRFPVETNNLVTEIREKASGVFLWVKLVVSLLVDGLEAGDDIIDLQNTLRSLPPDLRDLYRRMMAQMEPKYQIQAAELFQLFHVWNSTIVNKPLRTIVLCFAMQSQAETFNRTVGRLELETFRWHCQNTEARIRSRCCGLLEVSQKHGLVPASPATGLQNSYADFNQICDSVVRYLHRSVGEFLVSVDVWDEICGMTKSLGFNPALSLASGCLLMMKIARGFYDQDLYEYLTHVTAFLRRASNLSKDVLGKFLDEVDTVMAQHRFSSDGRPRSVLTSHWLVDLYHGRANEMSIEKLVFVDPGHYGSVSLAARTGLVQYLKAFGYFQKLDDPLRCSLVVRALASWDGSWGADPEMSLDELVETLTFLLQNVASPESKVSDFSLWQCALSIGDRLIKIRSPQKGARCVEMLKIFLTTAQSRNALLNQQVNNIWTGDRIEVSTIISMMRNHHDPDVRKLTAELQHLCDLTTRP